MRSLGGVQVTAAFRAPKRSSLLQVVKSAVATVAAWLVAGWVVQGPVPVFAAIAALLVVQPSLNQSFARAIERSVGVIAGVVVASLLGIAFGNGTWVILTAAAAGLLLAWAARMTPGTANQMAISGILVLALGPATPGYALDRVLETLLGAAIGFVVNVALVPPVAVAPARAAVTALGDELAASFRRLADGLETPRSRADLEELMLHARLLRPMRDKAAAALETAQESLTLNPRGGTHRADLAAQQRLLELYTPMITQLIGMTRTVYDGYAPDLAEEPSVRAIAEQLRRAAHDVELLDRVDEGSVPDEPPALTTPLQITQPSATHWILVGSLLEDLHRIHRGLQEGVDRTD
ncbi:aromatic acid exporter family protein [Microbacterium sp. SORGH_AS_0888]|uniref:FUSC family protein n=1 Tax=Microbacterium sp. SORGH_AS_0888 TaxID=3041791 RepID=UPI00277F3016|nr:FUSC family protein [Microbacterium sp. SORGH_AS_0888]MDQ1128842.1 putative membrane protein YccC [Microbacterium sp. SORGH_AS_0888]